MLLLCPSSDILVDWITFILIVMFPQQSSNSLRLQLNHHDPKIKNKTIQSSLQSGDILKSADKL